MRNEYGMQADSFHFSYDDKVYQPKEKQDNEKRVFFYARPVTPRRDFELGMLALNELCRRMPEIEVVFAGWDVSGYEIPFKHRNLGIVTPQVLADPMRSVICALLFRIPTFPSYRSRLWPATRSLICSKGANSSWMVNEENSILVDYDPIQIADRMEYYFNHPDELATIRKKGMDS